MKMRIRSNLVQITAVCRHQILIPQRTFVARSRLRQVHQRLCPLVTASTPVTAATGGLHVTNGQRYFSKLTRQYYKENRLIAPLFLYAKEFEGNTAIIDRYGKHRYQDLIERASLLALQLEEIVNVKKTRKRLNEARVATLCKNDISYVVAQWGTWIAEGVCVPLGPDHSQDDLTYRLRDSRTSVVVAEESLADRIRPVTDKLNIPLKILEESEYVFRSEKKFKFWNSVKGRPYGITEHFYEERVYEGYYAHKPALIVYTSGTTADPKGVVLTHGNLQAQMEGMVKAWKWSSSDTILHVLPLYHVHGIVNVLMTPLYCGATCVMHQKFDAEKVWNELIGRNEESLGYRINLFMAVPTIYAKLLNYYQSTLMRECGPMTRSFLKSCVKENIRLMVSGSDALPRETLNRWYDLTGHFLLERYGMTEVGMALTNKLMTVTAGNEEERQKLAGCVGNPFPGVEVRIVVPNVYSEKKYDVLCEGNSSRTTVFGGAKTVQGELMIKGPNVFSHYWRKPQQTKETFADNDWFKTGDFAEYDGENYKILGRMNVDIIKNGGYKVSALHIERHLCQHQAVDQVAVIGIPHPTWGQSVMAVVVPKDGAVLTLQDLQTFSEDRLTKYEKPMHLEIVESLPRNHMGKVNKKLLASQLSSE